MKQETWWIYRGTGEPRTDWSMPETPPWRDFKGEPIQMELFNEQGRKETYRASEKEIRLVNTALYLRRPLLVTGKPGTGKSSLARAVAHELQLGPLLRWPINTRSNLVEGLYQYDAIARLQDASLQKKELQDEADASILGIGKYIKLGPLGTSLLPTKRPRVLLVDEIDKSDIDLPNDLLHVFEEGSFEIPELARIDTDKPIEVRSADGVRVPIWRGKVICSSFPLVIMTSNDEREFPPAFLRRCLRLDISLPSDEKLLAQKMADIIESHLELDEKGRIEMNELISKFIERRKNRLELATDQLLNAVFLASQGIDLTKNQLLESIFRNLSAT